MPLSWLFKWRRSDLCFHLLLPPVVSLVFFVGLRVLPSFDSQPLTVCVRRGSWPSGWRRRDPSAKDPGRRRRWLTGGKRVSFRNPRSLLLSAVIFCNRKRWFSGSLPKVMGGLLRKLLKLFVSKPLLSVALPFRPATFCGVSFSSGVFSFIT